MSGSKTIQYAAGELLIKENELSRKMFILKSGKVSVFKNHMGNKISLATLGAGEIFGELSFFDAKPRSASVETITPCEIIVVPGEQLDEEMQRIPKWVFGVFKSVFNRFREMDNQLAQLQNVADFAQKAHGKKLNVVMIFMELHRFNWALRLLFSDLPKTPPALVDSDLLERSFSELIGTSKLSEKVYFLQMMEHNFLERIHNLGTNFYQIANLPFQSFDNYLRDAIENDHCYILSHGAIGLLRNLLFQIDINNHSEQKLTNFLPQINEQTKTILEELVVKKIISIKNNEYCFFAQKISDHFSYQSLIKSFDHSLNQQKE